MSYALIFCKLRIEEFVGKQFNPDGFYIEKDCTFAAQSRI